jgi:2,4-dienoyl-CoA reductase-like NADH-dependent reductase (Old Yellow Enzyme family)
MSLLLEPYTLRQLTLPNRIAVSPTAWPTTGTWSTWAAARSAVPG